MLGRPKLRPHLRFHAESRERTFILGGGDPVVLSGRLYPRLLPLLDGRRLLPEIVAALGEDASLVWFGLERLEAKGLLCEGDARLAPGVAVLSSTLGLDLPRAADRLEQRAVSVESLGGASVEALESKLRSSGLRTGGDPNAASLEIVLTDHYLRPGLVEVNRRALEHGTPWLLLRPTGPSPWLGPLFLPGVTGCYRCLEQRLRLNNPVEAALWDSVAADAAALALQEPPSVLEDPALALAVAEVLRWVLLAPEGEAGSAARLAARFGLLGHVAVLSGESLDLKRHPLTRRPQCPACGNPEARAPGPLELSSRPKLFTEDGGHRSLAPDETIERLKEHVNPVTGLIPAVHRRVAPSSPIHVYSTSTHLGVGRGRSGSLAMFRSSAPAGKGKSDRQAFASALGESLEHYSCTFTGDEPRVSARFGDLEGAIHPARLLHFSAAQYLDRERWNREHRHDFFHVPEPYDEAWTIDWTGVWSLRSASLKHLPTAACYFGYPFGDATPFCVGNSNGCAAGNNLEEAILQGFLELVERDAVALWWMNRLCRPGVDLGAFGEPYLAELSEYHRSRHRELWALDVTNDLGIPAFVVLLRRLGGSSERIVMGFGAHLSPRIALLRAATEANQMAVGRGTLEAGNVETGEPQLDAWLRTATVAENPYLAPDPAERPRTASDYRDLSSDDLRDDIRACVTLAARQDLDVLVLDQTRPDVGLSVARVVVPGLRHYWPRYGPGRLYDVPVKLGWVAAPLAESELNPATIL